MIDDSIVHDGGGRVLLRPLREQDVDSTYLAWFRDSMVTEFLDAKDITASEAIEYIRHGRETREYYMFAIIHKESGLHIGNLKIGPIQWRHRISDLVTVIGLREFWGSGYASEAIALGSRISFEELHLRKLSGGIAEGNIASIKAYCKAGWVIEGRLKGHHLIDGVAHDRILVSCFSPEFF